MADMAKLLAERRMTGARARYLPESRVVRDAYLRRAPAQRGQIEERMIPMGNDMLAFAEEQEFTSPIVAQEPGRYGRPLITGQVTSVDPNFAMQDPASMDLAPTITSDGIDFGGVGEFTPASMLEGDDLLTDEDFQAALEMRPGVDVGTDSVQFADPTGRLNAELAEYLMYSPNVKSGSIGQEDLEEAQQLRALLESGF